MSNETTRLRTAVFAFSKIGDGGPKQSPIRARVKISLHWDAMSSLQDGNHPCLGVMPCKNETNVTNAYDFIQDFSG